MKLEVNVQAGFHFSVCSRDLRIGRLHLNRIPNRIGRYDSNSNRIGHNYIHVPPKASSTLATPFSATKTATSRPVFTRLNMFQDGPTEYESNQAFSNQ